jgi:hypothetical protein
MAPPLYALGSSWLVSLDEEGRMMLVSMLPGGKHNGEQC